MNVTNLNRLLTATVVFLVLLLVYMQYVGVFTAHGCDNCGRRFFHH